MQPEAAVEVEPTVLTEPTEFAAIMAEPTQAAPGEVEETGYPAPVLEVDFAEGYPEPLDQQPSQAYPEPEAVQSKIELQKAVVIESYPHNSSVFTQGLVWADGNFYESGGLYGESALYKVGLEDGMPIQQIPIDEDFFAEGIALVDDRIIMLTWQSQTAIVFDRETFEETGRLSYTGQGWGLCFDENSGLLWMSDGSERVASRDPDTFKVTGEISVSLNGLPVTQINELECVDGVIYANLWKSDRIIGIDSATGNVTIEIDASGLLSAEEQAQLQQGRHVLNGIAYNRETERFYLTGKNWPKLFEVEFR